MKTENIINMLYGIDNAYAISYKDNKLNFLYNTDSKKEITSTELKIRIFDVFEYYISSELGEDSKDEKWWTAKSKDFEAYDRNEIVAILLCVKNRINKNIKNSEIVALTILEAYGKVLTENILSLEYEKIQKAITQLKHLEHYAHRTNGLWVTDRPDLVKEDLFFQLECEGFENDN